PAFIRAAPSSHGSGAFLDPTVHGRLHAASSGLHRTGAASPDEDGKVGRRTGQVKAEGGRGGLASEGLPRSRLGALRIRKDSRSRPSWPITRRAKRRTRERVRRGRRGGAGVSPPRAIEAPASHRGFDSWTPPRP